jgi:hypothetical protein
VAEDWRLAVRLRGDHGGRLLQALHGAAEATDWLSRHDYKQAVDEPATIASLYARVEGRDPSAITLARFDDATPS